MASVSSRSTERRGRVWDVRYRDGAGRQRSKTFERKVDAVKFAEAVEASKDDRNATVGALAELLHSSKDLRPTSTLRERTTLDRQVLPRWGRVRVRDVAHLDVVAWVVELDGQGLSPSTVRKARGMLSEVMSLAVRQRIIDSNPVDGVRVKGGARRRDPRPLEVGELEDLIAYLEGDAVPVADGVARASVPRPDVAELVLAAALTGMRQGELLALRWGDVDVVRGVVNVSRSVSNLGGRLTVGPTKSARARFVPLAERLAERWAAPRGGVDALVFPNRDGGLIDGNNMYKRTYRPAVLALGFEPAPVFHDLRHTYAALQIAAGASPKALQTWMGHSSITVTYDVYGHLMSLAEAETMARFDSMIDRERSERRK